MNHTEIPSQYYCRIFIAEFSSQWPHGMIPQITALQSYLTNIYVICQTTVTVSDSIQNRAILSDFTKHLAILPQYPQS